VVVVKWVNGMEPRVEIDLNARAADGSVPAGFESSNQPLAIGQAVLAVQSDDEIVADAIVERLSPERRTYFLRVKWETMRDDAPSPFSYTVIQPTGVVGGNTPTEVVPASASLVGETRLVV
jgi:hypothetical protein